MFRLHLVISVQFLDVLIRVLLYISKNKTQSQNLLHYNKKISAKVHTCLLQLVSFPTNTLNSFTPLPPSSPPPTNLPPSTQHYSERSFSLTFPCHSPSMTFCNFSGASEPWPLSCLYVNTLEDRNELLSGPESDYCSNETKCNSTLGPFDHEPLQSLHLPQSFN